MRITSMIPFFIRKSCRMAAWLIYLQIEQEETKRQSTDDSQFSKPLEELNAFEASRRP